jgi:adenylosuccinate synthase
LRAGDLLDSAQFREKFAVLAAAESALIVAAGGEALDVATLTARYTDEIRPRLTKYITDTVSMLHEAVTGGHHLLLEGAQATFLDLDHGTYPYVTSSNPTAGGACTGTGLGPRNIQRIVGITKAYCTRVGAGPFPTEDLGPEGEAMCDIGREFGTVTGRRRRTGWLDLPMLRYASMVNSLTELALTKLDVLDTFETIKVCVGYEIDGTRLDRYPHLLDQLGAVTPIYVELAGWNTSLSECREVVDLPDAARQFVELIERETDLPVRYVGVGPDRDAVVQFRP